MFEGFGSEIGVMNTALIALIGSFFVFLIKNLGPPWKWGKLIREMQEFRKVMEGLKDNPGYGKSNSGTVRLKPEQMPGMATECRENRGKLIKICTQIKDMEKDLEKHCEDNDRKMEKLTDKIDNTAEKIYERINEIRELIA